MKKLRFLVCFDMVLMPKNSAHAPHVVCWRDWQMRLRIRTVLRYRWLDLWGAFSGCSESCCRASAMAVFFLICCFQLLVWYIVFCPDRNAHN